MRVKKEVNRLAEVKVVGDFAPWLAWSCMYRILVKYSRT